MTTDIGRFEANERVDLADFSFVVDESMRSQSRHWADQFMRDPVRSAGPSWILDGFGITYVTSQLKVTKGRAILGHRENGEVFYGSLTTEGPVERIVDVSTFSNGTYDVFVRFELVDGESASRAFWSPQGDGSEFAQTIATRRLANWSVRVELSNPGAEWLKIGEAVVSGGVVTGVTPKRDFFFEGSEESSLYLSQWSSDGLGLVTDRNADRATYGVKSLHTFVGAMKQCIEDIRGRNLRRWWDRDIGGMNIGFDANPVEGRLAVGDANFYLDWQDANNVFLHWDAATGYFKYDRVTPQLQLWVDSTLAFRADDTGIRARGIAVRDNTGDAPVADQISCGFTSFRMEYDSATGDKYFRFDGTQTYFHFDDSEDELILKVGGGTPWKAYLNGIRMRGLAVSNGLDVAHVTDRVTVGDTNFFMDWDGTDTFLQWDDSDYLQFDRSTNELICHIDTADAWKTDPSGFRSRGIAISTGLTILPAVDSLRVGHNDFKLVWNSIDSFLYWDTNDYLKYDRSANELMLYMGTTGTLLKHLWSTNHAHMLGTNSTTSYTNEGDYGYENVRKVWCIRDANNAASVNTHEVKAASSLIYRNIALGQTVTGTKSTVLSAVLKGGAYSYKVVRATAWGTGYHDGTVTSMRLFWALTDTTPTTTDFFYLYWSADGTSSPDSDADQWWMEAYLFLPTTGGSVGITAMGRGAWWEAATHIVGQTYPLQHLYANTSKGIVTGFDMNNDFSLDILAQSSSANTLTLNVNGFVVEEMFGI